MPLRGVVHTWQHKGGRPQWTGGGIQYYSRLTPPTQVFSYCTLVQEDASHCRARTHMFRLGLSCGHINMIKTSRSICIQGIQSVGPRIVPRLVHQHTDIHTDIHTLHLSMISCHNLLGEIVEEVCLQPATSACIKEAYCCKIAQERANLAGTATQY